MGAASSIENPLNLVTRTQQQLKTAPETRNDQKPSKLKHRTFHPKLIQECRPEGDCSSRAPNTFQNASVVAVNTTTTKMITTN